MPGLLDNLRLAVICASNQNRSMEAHAMLLKYGYNVNSFGTSSQVKLPGPTIDRPNIYSFGTPYLQMYNELLEQNADLYRQNGVLPMLIRNSKIKDAPQKWQEQSSRFDLIITYEERVFDGIVEDFMQRGNETYEPVVAINLSVKDSHEEAQNGARQTLELIQMIDSNYTEDNWADHLDSLLDEFQQKTGKKVLYTILYY